MSYTEIKPDELGMNLFKAIGEDWMLVSANDGERYNTMTASWGGTGVLWGKPVAFVFIRPQRYTYEFIEKSDTLTLSFFGGAEREALSFCGSHSGRDCDKAAECGLTPFATNSGCTSFREATVIFECRKLYADMVKEECMLDKTIMSTYAKRDFHKMYICEITRVIQKNS